MKEDHVVIMKVQFPEGHSIAESLGAIIVACRDQEYFEIDSIRVATEEEAARLRLG